MALPNEPITRGEMYLSNIAGQGTALPSEPITREEMYLDAIAKNGGGGGTGEGDMKKSVYDNDLAVSGAGGIKAYVSGAIADKVDKVDGKGLSTNDYDDTAKGIVDGVTTALDGKISKSDTAGIVKNDGTIDTTISGAVSANTSAISGIKDGTSIDSFSDVETALSGKENTISDLSTIRSGASAGATAYQKPNDGIPKTDLASAVQTSLSKADSAVQDISGKADKVASATNGNFAGLDSNGNLTDSGKKSSDFATAASVTAIEGKIPSGASSSNKMATASDVTTITNGVIANTKLIKDTVGWSGKNKAIPQEGYALDGNDSTGFRITISGTNSLCYIAKVENGKSYIVSREAGNRFRIVGFKNYPSTTTKESTARDIYIGSASDNTYTFTNTGNWAYVVFMVNYDSSFDYSTAHGMIRDANILDDTYEPYFGSTAFPRSEQAVLGAKNLAPITLASIKALNPSREWDGNVTTHNGVTYTVNTNANGYLTSVETSGTATGYSFLRMCSVSQLNGSFILNGGVDNGKFAYIQNETTNTGLAYSYGADSNVVNLSPTANTVNCVIAYNQGASGAATFKPMIRLSTDPDPTYAHYAMTNQQLTDALNTRLFLQSESAEKAVTLKLSNTNQQILALVFSGGWRAVILLTSRSGQSTAYEDNIFTSDNTKNLGAQYVDGNIQIALPTYTNVNLLSAETFTVL